VVALERASGQFEPTGIRAWQHPAQAASARSSSDDYAGQLDQIADDACACTDRRCALEIKARVAHVLDNASSEDLDDKAGRASLDRIAKCVDQPE
jgi:hypothetical protein